MLGACKLDLRGAVISSPVTTINARVIMSSLEVIVPEGVEVDLEMAAFMSAKVPRLAAARPDRGALPVSPAWSSRAE